MADNGRWLPIAFTAFVVVVLAASALAILGNDRDQSSTEAEVDPTGGTAQVDTSASAPEAERGPEPKETAAVGRGERDRGLKVSRTGNPIVWVRYGEEVPIHSSPGGPVVETVADETEFGSRTILAVFETRGDWVGVPNPYTGNGNLGWVELDPSRLKSGYTVREIVVDLSEFRAQLLIADEVERTFTVSIGAPGTTTPTGRFAVTDTFRGDLNPAYGCCAVALTAVQPNLPSGWLGGNRIALHGTAGPLGVPISSGCVRAADRDVNALVNEVPPGAPVLVRQ
jgi:L,D-transpeptidase catalytic domain